MAACGKLAADKGGDTVRRNDILAEDEEVIMMARSRWTSFILPALLLAAYFGAWTMARRTGEDTLTFHVLMAAAGVWGVRFFARRLSTYLMLTNKRIYGEAGVLVTRTLDVPLDKVGGVYIEQSLLGRVTGRGTVTITTAGSQFAFPSIPSAVKFRAALMEEVKNAQDAADRRQSEALAEAIAASLRPRGRHPSRRLPQ